MPQILAFSSSLITLKFLFHNFFKTRVLLKIFDPKFSYKLSYFKHLCLTAKMAAETVTRFPNSLKSKLIISWAWELFCLMNMFSIFVTFSRSRNVFFMIYKWSTDLQVINFFSIRSAIKTTIKLSTSQQVRGRCKAESFAQCAKTFDSLIKNFKVENKPTRFNFIVGGVKWTAARTWVCLALGTHCCL